MAFGSVRYRGVATDIPEEGLYVRACEGATPNKYYIYIYVNIYINMYLCVRVCIFVCVYVSLCACMYRV